MDNKQKKKVSDVFGSVKEGLDKKYDGHFLSDGSKPLGQEYTILDSECTLHSFSREGQEKPTEYYGWDCEQMTRRNDGTETPRVLTITLLRSFSSFPKANWKWLEGYKPEDAFRLAGEDYEEDKLAMAEFVSNEKTKVVCAKAYIETPYKGYIYAVADQK